MLVKFLCGRFAARDDERLLLKTLQDRQVVTIDGDGKPYVRDVVRELNINENRAAYICQKWADRGWYNYGVNVLAGWLQGDGISAT